MTLPSRETVFPECDRLRVSHQSTVRGPILRESAERVTEEWISERISQTVLDTWGPPDMTRNVAVSLCRGLSSPGAYGISPRVIGQDSEAISALLDSARVWTLKQHVQFLAIGYTMTWVYVSISETLGRPTIELVPPDETMAIAHPDDPGMPIQWRRLRCRSITPAHGGAAAETYCWDVWSIEDPAAPYFGVFVAEPDGVMGRDVTLEATGSPRLEGKIVDGAELGNYPARYPDGSPFLPVVAHRSRDLGDMWGWEFGAGVFHGTLNCFLLNTYTMRTALDKTGDSYYISGSTPTTMGDSKQIATGDSTLAFGIQPGSVLFGTHEAGTNPFATKIGEGGSLDRLASFAKDLASSLSVDFGLTPADASRVGANPMSGLAIHLTNATKRTEQQRQEPLCRISDLEMVRKIVALARAAGLTTASADDVGILYAPIPLSPDEEKAIRDEDEWRVKQGLMSPIDLFVEWHPGSTRADAVTELARIAKDKQEIDALAGVVREFTVGAMQAASAKQDAVAMGFPKGPAKSYLINVTGVSPAAADDMIDGIEPGSYVPTKPTNPTL